MLKWTVTKRSVESCDSLATAERNVSSIHSRRSLGLLTQPNQPLHMRQNSRRSLGYSAKKSSLNLNKENDVQHYTSTPHLNDGISSYVKFESVAFRDVSNITPNSTPKTSIAATPHTNIRKRMLNLSPQLTSTLKKQQNPLNYASTLPTFDVEYSPCGGALATAGTDGSSRIGGITHTDGCTGGTVQTIRGLGIADSYYENPRYITDEIQQPPLKKRKSTSCTTVTATTNAATGYTTTPKTANEPVPFGAPGVTPLSSRLSELRFSKMSFKRNTEFTKGNGDNSLNSSAMGDMTLDKMIDAILESAKKEKWTPRLRRSISIKSSSNKEKQSKNTSSTYKSADDPANDLNEFNTNNNNLNNFANNNNNDNDYANTNTANDLYLSPEKYKEAAERTIILDETIISNEREVRTPDTPIQMAKRKSLTKSMVSSPIEKYYLKRQKAVRRKQKLENPSNVNNNINTKRVQDISLSNAKADDLVADNENNLSNISFDKSKSFANTRIGLTLPNGIPSPATPLYESSYSRKSYDELAQIQTPKEIAFVVNSDVKPVPLSTSRSAAKKEATDDLSGTLNSNTETPEINSDDLQGCSTPTGSENLNGTRRCLVFSPAISEDSSDKRRSFASSTLFSKYTKSATVKGSIDLHLYIENDKLYVNVIRCRDLQRTNGQSINAYVKVALLPNDNNENNFQRTAVHRNSMRPYFDHKFQFELKENDSHKRIQLAVWHRDREFKRSEFLGCTSFQIKHVYKRGEINGPYKLQPQSCLTNSTHPILEMCENSQSSVVDEVISVEDGCVAISNSGDGGGGGGGAAMNINKINNGGEFVEQILLSKKAIHQRDADENLFLRFLELDPPSENGTATGCANSVGFSAGTGTGTGINSLVSQQQQSVSAGAALSTVALLQSSSQTTSTGRRLSGTSKPILGRTPFTITKKLNRTDDKGFGFSIVWTHPPRIEKVEPNLSADKGGILPGDYVIFVDKHNVVTMPELDILKLIKSQGNTLLLEIFRRPTRQTNGVSLNNNNNMNNNKINVNINNTNNNNNPASLSVVSNMITSHNNEQPQQIHHPQHQLYPSKTPPSTLHLTQPQQSLQSQQQQLYQPQAQVIKQQFDNDSLKPSTLGQRSSAACSNTSLETTKRRLNLPQVTFSKESILPQTPDDHRRRFLYQLINREQHYISALQFGIERFALPLRERKDLISQSDHKTLFQNIDELVRISEDILEHLLQDDQEPQIHFASRVYLSKSTAICAAYKKYCNGLKRADCVLVNKSRNSNCDFMHFITVPPVPRKRPDLTTFIHRPLQHFREILKLNQLIASHCRVDSEEQHNFNSVINELQAAYREITVGGGLMEPLGEGRPLLTLQDLESRLVFTKCKPFVLAAPGRQWIFGGDLSRVEGRSIKPYWALLFSDILLFAKVSRDRVLFITEEPLSLTNIVDTCFNIRKKNTEFRITTDPNGRTVESPTVHCAPDLSRTPRKNSKRRSIILRAPSVELKAVWQNLLTRQIFLVNAFGSTPMSSPLESPDVMQILIPLADTSAATNIVENINLQNQNHQQSASQTENTKHLNDMIDEKCRTLDKAGTPRGSALHLAQWIKCQLDKQVIESDPIESDSEHSLEDWSVEQVRKRSHELKLIDSNGFCQTAKVDNSVLRVCETKMEELTISETEEESKSASRSTTSDSQITVRSSPINKNRDALSVCRQCHKNCKNKLNHQHQHSAADGSGLSSLKVQHSQSSPNRCCSSHSIMKSDASTLSSATSTLTTPSTKSQENNNNNIKSNSSNDSIQNLNSKNIENNNNITQNNSNNSKNQNKPDRVVDKNLEIILRNNNGDNYDYKMKRNSMCTCKCRPKDFEKSTLSPDELLKEKVKIISNQNDSNTKHNYADSNRHIERMQALRRRWFNSDNNNVPNDTSESSKSDCVCKPAQSTDISKSSFTNTVSRTDKKDSQDMDVDDWSLMLIGLAQINPTASLVHIDPFDIVPTISIVPPTPESTAANKYSIWDTSKLQLHNIKELELDPKSDDNSPDISPEDSPQDEEPPYKALNTVLKRYGTMSSLERVPSDDTDEKTYVSSDEEDVENDDDDDSESDIKIITKEVYGVNNQQSFRNWTARAGSFLEESRAFIDKYLGRNENCLDNKAANEDDENVVEAETSGATSGEEVWGTPTSGENEDLQTFSNIDHSLSSPTKSSSSYTGDEDTELMMDELLMAPPMTASAVRGLLPRRRLEPLFEEDTESAEETDDEDENDEGENDDENDNLPLNRKNMQQGQVLERSFEDSVDLEDSIELDSAKTSTPSLSILTTVATATTVTTPSSTTTSAAVVATASTTPSPTPPPLIEEIIDIASESTKRGTTTTVATTTTTLKAESCGKAADNCAVSTLIQRVELKSVTNIGHAGKNSNVVHVGLSPRLEMRLALNQDIMGDEDLINYNPGPDLTTILGHDLSSYHRMTGKDIIMNRIINRQHQQQQQQHQINYLSIGTSMKGMSSGNSSVNSSSINLHQNHLHQQHLHPHNHKQGMNSFCQQNNSKMDTPTPNRKKSSSHSTWNNFGSVDREERTFSDLERLARREKIYCMTQLKCQLNKKKNFSHEEININTKNSNKLLNFFNRRNSENQLFKLLSKENVDDLPSNSSLSDSSRFENDKRLDRRFWKQLSKRRRSNSVSEVGAN